MPDPFHFHDAHALIERLTNGLKKHRQEAVLLVGSPLSAPVKPSLPGVPDVSGIIELIQSEFADDPTQLSALNEILRAGGNRYEAAFLFLLGRRGQQTANELVRTAVRAARLPDASFASIVDHGTVDDACRAMDLDIAGWALSPGTEAIGKLIANYPERFGHSLLTTNFDPLIEVAIRRAGGSCFRTTLHSDGNFSQTEGDGCHVIHLHGYWYGSDTLHTNRQLSQARPQLKASLASLLRNRLVVVCGYGGWDDAFTEALMEVVRDDTAYPEIIWTFYSEHPTVSDRLSSRLCPGIDRGRVNLYAGVDCHQLFSNLHDVWYEIESPKCRPSVVRSNPVHISNALSEAVAAHRNTATFLEGDDEDRPPVIDICVGREDDLKSIRTSHAKVVFITGLGGQGKSTVAARYFTESQKDKAFSVFVWRDCKEEGERFENQLSSIVERLSKGTISGPDLAKQSAASIIQMLLTFIKDLNILCVFDNVDHYVNLETGLMTGNTNAFVEAFLKSDIRSRIIFTCRPSVYYDHPLALSRPLTGLDLQAALRLFAERGATSTTSDVEDAHRLTEGHAFWLDLLAIQVRKRAPSIGLRSLVDEIRSGGGPLPTKTLKSVWATLKEREQVVLRALAETVKPDTEVDIGEYLSGTLNYNRVIKALTALRALNLVVIKRRSVGTDLLELHPLVRQFVRNTFSATERISYIRWDYPSVSAVHRETQITLIRASYFIYSAILDPEC